MGTGRLWAQIYSGEEPSPLLVTQNQAASVEQDNTMFSFTGFPSSPLTYAPGRVWLPLLAEIHPSRALLHGGEKQEATGQARLSQGTG